MTKSQIWDLFTSKAEYNAKILDKYDRPITSYTREGNMLDPVVSNHLLSEGFTPEFPDNRPFAVCLSHDVDDLIVKPSKKNLAKQVLTLNIKDTLAEVGRNFSRKIDPLLDLRWVFDIEEQYDIKATYYFLSVEKDNIEDHNYDLDEVKSYFKTIQDMGSEVGLHGSKLASHSLVELQKEKNRLNKFVPEIVGYRNHFLKFSTPLSWNNLQEAGFLYDTTFGAAACAGFRNGMCHPYQPYDLNKKSWLDIYEIPLIAMDVSFFNYLGLTYEKAFELFKLLALQVKKSKGIFSFLWHNNYLHGEMGDFYRKCIAFLKEEDAWFATGREAVEWWQQKGYFEQQKEILASLT